MHCDGQHGEHSQPAYYMHVLRPYVRMQITSWPAQPDAGLVGPNPGNMGAVRSMCTSIILRGGPARARMDRACTVIRRMSVCACSAVRTPLTGGARRKRK